MQISSFLYDILVNKSLSGKGWSNLTRTTREQNHEENFFQKEMYIFMDLKTIYLNLIFIEVYCIFMILLLKLYYINFFYYYDRFSLYLNISNEFLRFYQCSSSSTSTCSTPLSHIWFASTSTSTHFKCITHPFICFYSTDMFFRNPRET